MTSAPPRVRVLSAQLLLLLFAFALGTSAFGLALPVLPLTVAANTHNQAIAGSVTAVLAGFTIALEVLSPALLRRVPIGRLLVAAMLVQLVAMAGFAALRTLPAMLLCGALAGAGFGVTVTVTVVALDALAPPGRSGEAIGYFGLAASVPSIVGPVGLLLLDARGAGAVFLAGALTCAAAALISALLRIGPSSPRARASGRDGVLAAMGGRGVSRLWLAFLCATLAYGAVASFTPLLLGTSGPGSAPVFLLVFALTRMLGRVAAGRAADRLGERRLALPSLAAGAVALALLQVHAPLATVLAAAGSGTAFGVVQTAAFVGMLHGAGRERSAGVSGIWSVAIDAGIGGGALGMGAASAAVGLGRAFWLVPALFGLAFVLRLPGPSRD